jgi:serine/threonine protein kinase/Tol biopolymer transport system component
VEPSDDAHPRPRLREGLDIRQERWPDVSRLFSAALELAPAARDSYLDEACRNDSALRAAVDSLLGAYDQAGLFGETSLLQDPSLLKRLAPGTELGPFRIETLLGAGGMGEVYRAHDRKLQRAVAIKVLPDFFANDPDRRARFEDEARALAALNHPHIAAIYGLEESAGIAALVLELVDGPTLAEWLADGPLPLDDIIRIARQLAEGLEAAHDRGIVHRDLKPANIKFTPEGDAKILDFGLAKARGGIGSPGQVSSPASRNLTSVGAIVGTASYMSPEQARGQTVDKRTDIWAFGCVLFEMCAARPPFSGATVGETLAAIVERDPDWHLLPPGVPPTLVRLLRRCLTKDPKIRLRDIGEARVTLTEQPGLETIELPLRRPRRLMRAAAAAGAVLAGVLLGIVLYRAANPHTTASTVRFVVPPPDNAAFVPHPGRTFFALSPDGSQLAFVASSDAGSPDSRNGPRRIWVRTLSDLEARPLPGTEGAMSVFWSPDGRSLAFLAADRLKRIDLPNGAVVTVCEVTAAAFRHGSWGAGGVILMGRGDGTAIESVPAAGGELRTVLARDQANHEVRVHWPWFLPYGDRFLYTARLEDGEGELRIGRLDGSSRAVMRVSSNTQWVEPDVVVFVREGVLMGQRVDLDVARPIGEPFSIAERVEYFFTTSRAMFSASRNGAVAYHQGIDLSQLLWADGDGGEVGTIGPLAGYQPYSGRLSRDGTSLLTARRQAGLGTFDIWRLDLVRGTEEQLTYGRGSELAPVWVNGEREIVFSSDSPGTVPHLFRRDLATGNQQPLLPPGHQQLAADVFPGNRAIAFVEAVGGSRFQMFQLPINPPGPPTALLPTPYSSWGLRLSPDGSAMAYFGEDASGSKVFVALVGATSPPVLAAQDVSAPPVWSPDGKHVYFVAGDDMVMGASVSTTPRLAVGTTRPLFKVKRQTSLLDVSSDGRFLLLVPQQRAAEHPIVVGTAAIESARR